MLVLAALGFTREPDLDDEEIDFDALDEWAAADAGRPLPPLTVLTAHAQCRRLQLPTQQLRGREVRPPRGRPMSSEIATAVCSVCLLSRWR